MLTKKNKPADLLKEADIGKVEAVQVTKNGKENLESKAGKRNDSRMAYRHDQAFA